MKKQVKVVQVIARYAHKNDGVKTGLVSYKVRSSDGKNCYCTTILNGEAIGCSCPARKPCYHMTQLETIEQARRAESAHKAFIAAQAMVSALVQPVVVEPVVEEISAPLVTPAEIEAMTQDNEVSLLAFLHVPYVQKQIEQAQLAKRMAQAPMTKNNQAFSLTR